MSQLAEPAFQSFDDLRAAAEHYRLALDAGGIGAWEWELASGRMHWSTQMFRNLGLEPRPDGDLHALLLAAVHPDECSRVASEFVGFRGRLGPMRIEARVVWPDGGVHWIVFLGKVEPDAAGRPSRMLGITIDGTRRRQAEVAAEAAVRESERRLRELNEKLEQLAEERARQLDASRAQIRAIYDNSPDWLSLFRAARDGRFVYEDLNRATESAYGLPREQVVGQPLENVLGLEPAQQPLRHMRTCVATGENQRYTARRTLAGVTRTIDVMFARVPEKQDGDYLVMATARDITEREEMEQQLRQAQKMEAVGQLTGGVAHDFNNLLTAILGNLELLAPRLAGDPVGLRFLGGAQRAAQNGGKLTEQLLAFSRRQHLQPRPVDLNRIVDGTRDMLARTIGAAVEVRTDLASELWPAMADPTQIEIAILNLALNSRDAMPLGGALTIETRNLPSGAGEAPRELAGRDCVWLSVRDTGSGMTEEVLRSAVEPFFTTKPVGQGSGLGLSQVYGMVRQSNGFLRIDSNPGAGTAVHLYLPRATAAAEALDQTPEPTTATAAGGRILVVDDDPGVREITVQMLREAGYEVSEAASGEAAIDRLSSHPGCDLIVVDIAMPGLNGVDTLRRARQRRPGLPALYITGYAEMAGDGALTGDGPVLKKPFRMGELTAAVRLALNRDAGRGDPGRGDAGRGDPTAAERR